MIYIGVNDGSFAGRGELGARVSGYVENLVARMGLYPILNVHAIVVN